MARTVGQWVVWVLDWLGRIQTLEFVKSVVLGAVLSGISYLLSAPPYIIFALFVAGCCLALGLSLGWQMYKQRHHSLPSPKNIGDHTPDAPKSDHGIERTEEIPSAGQQCAERILIESTPEDLIGLFHGHTEIQGHQLIAAYLGKWIKVTGSLNNVTLHKSPFSDDIILFVSVKQHPLLMMAFNKEWKDRLAVLRPGHTLTILGQICEIRHIDCSLENCELVTNL